MFLDGIIRAIRTPIETVRAKVFGIRQIPSNAKGELNQLKNVLGQARNEVKGGADAARNAAGKAGGAVGAAKGKKPKKMGLFSRKPKCPGCGQKLHPTWDQCPYCGAQVAASGAQAVAAPAASGGAQGKPRTMALEVGAGGGGSGAGLGWLVPLEGMQGGEILTIKGRAVVGTNPDCDVVMRDQSISGRHAEFVPSPGGFRVNDLGSTNGTFVNDKRVTSEELIDNDSVRIGKTNCKWKAMT